MAVGGVERVVVGEEFQDRAQAVAVGIAVGAFDAIASRGLKVPADVSVVGFDDISTASHVFPRLTTMHQPYEALAERAVREVVEMIEGRPPAAARIAFDTELVVRDSTGPAPT